MASLETGYEISSPDIHSVHGRQYLLLCPLEPALISLSFTLLARVSLSRSNSEAII